MRLTLLPFVIAAALVAAAAPARADLNVFACEPEWGALVKELGGDKVEVYVATNGLQDPHQVQARPSLIAKARAADLTVCTGAELEIGWMPMIERQAANPKIVEGADGAFAAASYVRLQEIPARLDRAEGDVHAAGNPHIQTDPRNIAAAAVPLAQRMIALDPANAETYKARYADFAKRWNEAMARWAAEAAPLKGVPVAVQHKNWIYLFDWLGLDEVVSLEPKPGVPPSSGYLAEVLDQLSHKPVKMVIRAAYEDERPSAFIAERAKIPQVVLPFTVGGDDEAKDLFSLYDDTIRRLLAGLGK
jgi:zinc/manganese transport system substrate-binding protein